jgi:Methyltransferase domain
MHGVKYFRPDDMGNRFRLKRFILFKEIVDQIISQKGSCHILDIGGTPRYWDMFRASFDLTTVKIDILNLTAPPTDSPSITTFVGDARNISQFDDFSFDVVHSNSVIEHVGRWADMASMAKEIRRLAPRYFVQTPYFWFPLEPHARFPLFHWMPESWRYRIIMKRTCGCWQQQPDVESATMAVQSALLLDKRQMKYLFPDAKIVSEKVFGLIKSLVAIR